MVLGTAIVVREIASGALHLSSVVRDERRFAADAEHASAREIRQRLGLLVGDLRPFYNPAAGLLFCPRLALHPLGATQRRTQRAARGIDLCLYCLHFCRELYFPGLHCSCDVAFTPALQFRFSALRLEPRCL